MTAQIVGSGDIRAGCPPFLGADPYSRPHLIDSLEGGEQGRLSIPFAQLSNREMIFQKPGLWGRVGTDILDCCIPSLELGLGGDWYP